MEAISIVPTQHLHLTGHQKYHLVLAQAIGKDQIYTGFYRERSKNQDYIILDNGSAEGERVSMQELHEKAQEIGASELVLPDEFFDSVKTMWLAQDCLGYLYREGWEGNIMAVPQGRDLTEWTDCALNLLNTNMIDCIGVPKNLVHTAGWFGRVKAIQRLEEVAKEFRGKIKYHLLGCWLDPREVGVLHHVFYDVIRTVDSRLAYLYTANGLVLDPNEHNKPHKKEMPFSAVVDEQLLEKNIERWEEYCYGRLW